MGKIEREATNREVISRLGELLAQSARSDFSTTSALAICTALFAWTAERVRRPDDEHMCVIEKRWRETTPFSGEWGLPPEFPRQNVYEALLLLRNATAHAQGYKVAPKNNDHLLVGFEFDLHRQSFELSENQLRTFGVTLAREFAAHLQD